MPRPLRDQSAGIRHITCRGNRRQAIFVDHVDRDWWLRILEHACGVFSWRVFAWCLMTNHVHLVLETPAGTISRGMQLVCGDYAQGFNWRHGHTGHLFQGRFRSDAVDKEAYLAEVIRYVDLNPERAAVVASAEEWRWSSYRAHLGLNPPQPFHDVSWVRSFGSTPRSAAAAYANFVQADRLARPIRT